MASKGSRWRTVKYSSGRSLNDSLFVYHCPNRAGIASTLSSMDRELEKDSPKRSFTLIVAYLLVFHCYDKKSEIPEEFSENDRKIFEVFSLLRPIVPLPNQDDF